MAKKTIEQLEKELAEALAKLEAAEKSALGIISERDEARAEVEKLRNEIKQLEDAEKRWDESMKVALEKVLAAQERADKLEAENKILSGKLASLQPANGRLAIIDDELTDSFNAQVREKIRAGLSEAQAIEVIKTQEAEDAERRLPAEEAEDA